MPYVFNPFIDNLDNTGSGGGGGLSNPVTPTQGGTGVSNPTARTIPVAEGASNFNFVGPGTAGQVLQSGGAAADPSYSTATYPSTSGTSGKVLQSNGTNWVASTPTFPTAAGTSGKVLQSNGTNYVESTPTYPSTSGSAGKIIRSNGTNNVYTTATYPNTTTANQLLYSSAANTIGGLTTAANRFLTTNGSSVPSLTETYTTGTWTPTLRFGGGNTGISYLVQEGYYVQIGALIFLSFYINLSSKGSSTGDATLEGFPVNVGPRGYAMAWNIAQYNLSLDTNYTVPFLSPNSNASTASIYQSGSGQTPIPCDDTNFSNSSLFSGSFIYGTNG